MGAMTAMTRRKERAGRAVELAATLLREARAQETPAEIAQARRLARMMDDPRGKELTIALVDQAFRSRRPERIADQLSYLLHRYGTPHFMEWWERVALMLGGVMGHYLPSVIVPPIVARLRVLYQQALRHHYRHPDGHLTPKFINLDMEEHRDLDLTVTAFREVLDEEEFAPLRAGVVLQAYLPESHRVQRALTAWAIERRRRGGAPIKLRIVKGANLAMERIEAAVHGWPQAPYTTKAEVDANFKRMVEYGCHPERAQAVHLGIASHNLLDVAHGLLLREAEGLEPFVEFEMLEGMANHQARALQARAGGLLLYAPVVRAEDFHSAIAYLVRRLDENTAPENFLRHVFDLEPGSPEWIVERDRFLAAFGLEAALSDAPRRSQDRRAEASAPPALRPLDASFANEPDTDWTLAANRAWIDDVVRRWRERSHDLIPLQIGGEIRKGLREGEGRDPSRPGHVA